MSQPNKNKRELEEDVIEVTGQMPSARDEFYQELGYKEPVDSSAKIEDTAKFLSGAVTFSCGALLTAMKIGVSLAGENPLPLWPWCMVIGFWIGSILCLLMVLFPLPDRVRTDSPSEMESSYRRSRKTKYRYLVAGTLFFVGGLVAGLASAIGG